MKLASQCQLRDQVAIIASQFLPCRLKLAAPRVPHTSVGLTYKSVVLTSFSGLVIYQDGFQNMAGLLLELFTGIALLWRNQLKNNQVKDWEYGGVGKVSWCQVVKVDMKRQYTIHFLQTSVCIAHSCDGRVFKNSAATGSDLVHSSIPLLLRSIFPVRGSHEVQRIIQNFFNISFKYKRN